MKEFKLVPPNSPPQHRELIDTYCRMYHAAFESPYLFNGGKDGAAVKRFLEAGIGMDLIVDVLRMAFNRSGYPWDSATTICGFISAWPRLVAERAKIMRASPGKAPQRWELNMQINFVKEQISQHPHNSDSIYENKSAQVDVPLEFWKRKLEELKLAYAKL